MTFTREDAKNDGLIKREVGKEMKKVAKTQNPQVYDHFVNVCEEIGRDPADVFGEMAVRSLNSEDFANRVFSSEISRSQLEADEIRLEDVQYVKQLSEELGLNETTESHDPIDQLINQRLQSITQSPIPRLRNEQNAQDTGDNRVMEYMERLDQRLDEMEGKMEEGRTVTEETPSSPSESDKPIDDLFAEGDASESEDFKEEPQMEPEPEPEPSEDVEEEIPEGAAEEAFEGMGNVEDASSPMEAEPENPFSEIDDEVEVENRGHEEEAEAEEPAFSSEEAEEE